MATYPLYADIHKKATDLLTKDFPTSNKFEFKQPKIQDYFGLELSTSEKDGSPVGTLTPKIYIKAVDALTLAVTADTKRNVKAEITYEDVKNAFKLNTTVTSDSIITIAPEYKHKHASLNGTFTLNSPKGLLLNVAAVAGKDQAAFGIQTEFNISAKTVNDINASLSYTPAAKNLTLLGVFLRFKKSIFGTRLVLPVEPRLSLVAEAEFNYSDTSEPIRYTLAGVYEVDKITNTTVKGKVESNGTISASLTTRINSTIKTSFGTSFNTNNQSGRPTYGLSLLVE